MANSVSIGNGSSSMVGWGDPSQVEEAGADVSPDALMAYCQARLDSIGGQVTTTFDEQQQNASATQQIDQVIADIRGYASADKANTKACTQLESELKSTIDSLTKTDPGCPALPALTKTYNAMVWSGDGGPRMTGSTDPNAPNFIEGVDYDQSGPQGDGILSSGELQTYTQNLTDATSDLNSNAELGMVHLQSLMSQQQMAVTLTTNLVQSLGDQENKIADNIGH